MDLKKYLNKQSGIIERRLAKIIPDKKTLIGKSMDHSLLAGGKRLRPILVIEGAKVCGFKKLEDIFPAACAVEFVHTYSLVHDDLPAMDNDDLRRGKPTNHKKFGEAVAILAGDGLLTEAFRLICLCKNSMVIKLPNLLKSIEILSEVSGYKGMIEGQIKDTVESGAWSRKSRNFLKVNLKNIHLNKTAALLRGSLTIGATLAGGSKDKIRALDEYGKNIGLAFQITDDILDITADKKLLGKRGSDKDNNKLTYPAIYGIEESKRMAEKLVENAKKSISIFGKKNKILCLLADYIINREY
ncbi:polyprenyl synthetase family protein [Elusimicrobiota bacterium]